MTSLIFCWLASFLSPANCPAQEGIITPNQASRSGLVVQWFSQLDATDAESIVDLALVIDEDRATTFFQITGGRLSETISEYDLSPFGQPFGIEGAKEFAGIRKEIFEAMLKRDQIEAEVKIEQYSIPETTLYAITKTGVLNAVDAESGKLRWRLAVGDRRVPTIGMGASKSHIAVADGSTVYCLDSRTGKTLWQQAIRGSVSASPVVNDTFVFVPLDNGRLQTLPIDSKGFGQSTYVALGNPINAPNPILEGTSVAWATSRGVTVAPADQIGSMRFRISTDSPVVCTPVGRNGIFFVASSQGSVYAVSESGAELFWHFPTGERISLSPIPLGDDLYVITENRNLHCFDARSGVVKAGWEQPLGDIVQYVGAGENHIYLLNTFGQLVTIDRKTGSSLGRVSSNLSLRSFSNLQSDRLYICHQSGLIQCLREAASERPKFHSGEFTQLVSTENKPVQESTTDAAPSTNPFDTGNSNPFGGGAAAPASDNPFGGGAATPPANDNPFGGGATPPANDNPFGGGGSTPPAGGNPFGGGSGTMPNNDPFAGGGSSAAGGGTDPFAGGGSGGQANNSGAGNLDEAQKLTLWKDVEAVFKKRCGTCHGSNNPKGSFDTSSAAALLRGGDSGEPIKAGDAQASRLYQLITHADEPKMPPNGNKIPNAEIKLIEEWINSGALETQPAAAAGGNAAGGAGDDPFAGGK